MASGSAICSAVSSYQELTVGEREMDKARPLPFRSSQRMIHSKGWARQSPEDGRTKVGGLLVVGGLLEGSLEEVAFRRRLEGRVLENSFSQGLRELGRA